MNLPQVITFNGDIGASIGVANSVGIIAFNQLSKIYGPGASVNWDNETKQELVRMAFVDSKSIEVVIGWLGDLKAKMDSIEFSSYSLASWKEES